MTEYRYTTGDLAHELGLTRQTVVRRARALGIGIDVGGSAGFRYSETDRQALLDSLRVNRTPDPERAA